MKTQEIELTSVAEVPEQHGSVGGNGDGQSNSNSGPPQQMPWPISDLPTPRVVHEPTRVIWDESTALAENLINLATALSECGDLYRNPKHGGGLMFAPTCGNIAHRPIETAADLAPLVADRLQVTVLKNGKVTSNRPPDKGLTLALRTEVFLQHFLPLDSVTSSPYFLGDFSLTAPGYNDAGVGQRVLYVGPPAAIAETLTATNKFLDEMAWASDADRANALAAGLTVLLRNHWLGEKPAIVATASKSHAGKDTVIAFATGNAKSASISYQSTDWALERCFVGARKTNPDAGVIVVENARLSKGNPFIASGFLERVLTDPEPLMFSTGTGAPARRPNDFVIAISTNYGKISNDLMNRALPIHLEPVGDVHGRVSSIGNPKHEYLPDHRDEIEAELRGLVVRWVEAGRPLDETVKHPFTDWARTIGGILKVAGVPAFLANYGFRRTEDDPVRQALGLAGVARPDTWLRTQDWVQVVSTFGFRAALIPEADRESIESKCRHLGIIFSAHQDEIFEAATEDVRMTVQLQKARRRFHDEPEGSNVDHTKPGPSKTPTPPTTRYRFRVISTETIPEDKEN